jgi:hypothetical protein
LDGGTIKDESFEETLTGPLTAPSLRQAPSHSLPTLFTEKQPHPSLDEPEPQSEWSFRYTYTERAYATLGDESKDPIGNLTHAQVRERASEGTDRARERLEGALKGRDDVEWLGYERGR